MDNNNPEIIKISTSELMRQVADKAILLNIEQMRILSGYNIGETALQKLCSSGEIKCIATGGKSKYITTRANFEAFIAKRFKEKKQDSAWESIPISA